MDEKEFEYSALYDNIFTERKFFKIAKDLDELRARVSNEGLQDFVADHVPANMFVDTNKVPDAEIPNKWITYPFAILEHTLKCTKLGMKPYERLIGSHYYDSDCNVMLEEYVPREYNHPNNGDVSVIWLHPRMADKINKLYLEAKEIKQDYEGLRKKLAGLEESIENIMKKGTDVSDFL